MSAYANNQAVAHRINRRTNDTPYLTNDDGQTLRRAEMTLARWGESECGDGSNWYTSRDEDTGLTYKINHETGTKHRCPDLEAGALRRVADLCKRLGLHYFHQTDPRGCLLYVGTEPLTDQNYSQTGIPCCV